MAQNLIIIGAAIFGILGSIHLFYTFFTNKFDPYDLSVKQAMMSTSPILSKETTIWKSWIGFNASHSLGAIFFAAIYIPLTLSHFSLIEQSRWFTWLPVFVGLCFLCLARKYWFNIPFFGILTSTACYITAAILITMPG